MPPRFQQVNAPNLNAVSQILSRATADLAGGLQEGARTFERVENRKKNRKSSEALLRLAAVTNEAGFNDFVQNPGIAPTDFNDFLTETVTGFRGNLVEQEQGKAAAALNRATAGSINSNVKTNAANQQESDNAASFIEEYTRKIREGKATGADVLAAAKDRSDGGEFNSSIIPSLVDAATSGAASRESFVRNDRALNFIDESGFTLNDALNQEVLSGKEAADKYLAAHPDATPEELKTIEDDFNSSTPGQQLNSIPLSPAAQRKISSNNSAASGKIRNIRNSNPAFNFAAEVRSNTQAYEKRIQEEGYSQAQFATDLISQTTDGSDHQAQIVRGALNTTLEILRNAGVTDVPQQYAVAERILKGNTKDIDTLRQYINDGVSAGTLIGATIGTIAGAPGGPATAAGGFTIGSFLGFGTGGTVGFLKYFVDKHSDEKDTNNQLSADEKKLIAGIGLILSGGDENYNNLSTEVDLVRQETEAANQDVIRTNKLSALTGEELNIPRTPTNETAEETPEESAGLSTEFTPSRVLSFSSQLAESLVDGDSTDNSGRANIVEVPGAQGGRPNRRQLAENAARPDVPTISTGALSELPDNVSDIQGITGAIANSLEISLGTELTALAENNKNQLNEREAENLVTKVVKDSAEREGLTADESNDIIQQILGIIAQKALEL